MNIRKRPGVFTMTAFLVLVTFTALIPGRSFAEFMTVGDLKSLIESGKAGEVTATAYVQGTVDGLLAMDSLLEKEDGKTPEFCKFFEEAKKTPLEHPAYKTKLIVHMWGQTGRPMSTLAVDMIIMYMTAQFGCEK